MTNTTCDLIQRMAKELDLYRQMARDNCTSTHPFADEARAYLSQPEPEGVTDEEIEQEALKNADSDDEYRAFKSGAFFVQERISRPAIEPVPVSERLPGEGDCDPSFQCWWFTPSEEKWILWPIKWAGPECSHWLPHYDLPVPTTTETP